ncbi:alcohol dehydrogenase catalytic domain-containing protein [Ruicaihuangia caeni]|uniref:Alcohol dehydrogenase catalytic domain-containing protein n=1 Tax=Ruicaihuangia caeni TaxID=3042517 RepID=A0AAW6TC19_9MICO|nr:alcohol dehydrogenase catalytic domain-containing protein [Klugiella sp. YN-L-19]MDI2098597.1 alcohol dehydrogenase catalytic domain-containing protein [Klugiella sp. YN-L-19]
MKVVRLVGKEQIRVEDAPDAQLQSDDDAIVRVTHSAICGADLLPYHGYTPGFEFGTIPGHEFVGEIVAVGDRVTAVKPGMRVVNTSMTSDGTCRHCRAGRPTQCENRSLFGYSGVYPRLDGGQAELVRVPFANRSLFEVPEGVTNEQAVFIADILPTGFAGVRRAGVGFGDVVVVLGCGPVGLMSIISSAGTARTVIAVDGVAERRELAEQLGATAVSPDDAPAAVERATAGLGADVVIEASGSVPAMKGAFDLARPQGVVSVIGAHFEPDFPLNNGTMFEKELTLVFSVGDPSRDRERLLAGIQAGSIDPSPVLTHSMPLDEAQEAYRAFDAKEMTKVVLTTA